MEETNFRISDNAAKRIKYLISQEENVSMMRISVDGGGCSGFKYNFDLVDKIEEDDHVFDKDMAKVVIDDLSLSNFLKGAELDFIEDLSGSSFEIKNPNSSARCGCGNSFAI